MTRKTFKNISRLCLLTFCAFSLPQIPQALARDYDHHNKHHRYHDDEREYGYREGRQGCRPIVQEFQLSKFFTYTESGLACRDGGGVWQIVSDTKYPALYGQVYFFEHGQRVYFGQVSPRQRPQEPEYRHCEHEEHEHGDRDDFHQDVRDYGYLDKNNYKRW